MKKLLITLATLALVSGTAQARWGHHHAPPPPPPPAPAPPPWRVANYTNLVRDYEFANGLPSDWTALNDSTKGYDVTIFNASQVSGGTLTATDTPSNGYPYQGGWISTAGAFSFTYGRVDFVAKIPAGQGLWPALWLQGPKVQPQPEIDVQEAGGGTPQTVYASLHDWNQNGTQIWSETQALTANSSLADGFHDYELIWQPGMVTWLLDGTAYAQYTLAQASSHGYPWPFSTPEYLICTLAVGSNADFTGAPDASTPFPSDLVVQSVKVYQ
jgi:beta-glucanase (GH16 family)